MPRPLRADFPGAVHHVTARGIAHRPVFETRADVRYFLSLLARAVRAGRIEVLAYTVLTTHFHLLVRTRRGGLAPAMQWVLGCYACRFNRWRGRDGPVFRDRYFAKPVRRLAYWMAVIAYIDRNAVDAELVQRAQSFPHGSAWQYARPKGPPWLARTDVETFVRKVSGAATYAPEDYDRAFRVDRSPGLAFLIEQGKATPDRTEDAFADLLLAAPVHVRRWLVRNAKNADGIPVGLLLLHPNTVQDHVARCRTGDPGRALHVGHRRVDCWAVLEAGLLRTVSGLAVADVAGRTASSSAGVHLRIRTHLQALTEDRAYADVASALVGECIGEDFAALRAALAGAAERLPSIVPKLRGRRSGVATRPPGSVPRAGDQR